MINDRNIIFTITNISIKCILRRIPLDRINVWESYLHVNNFCTIRNHIIFMTSFHVEAMNYVFLILVFITIWLLWITICLSTISLVCFLFVKLSNSKHLAIYISYEKEWNQLLKTKFVLHHANICLIWFIRILEKSLVTVANSRFNRINQLLSLCHNFSQMEI